MDVGVWIRVSTDLPEQKKAVETHLLSADNHCKKHDHKIITTYLLDGVSGKALLNHPETKRMLADVASGKIKGLVFAKLARLARSTKDLLYLAEYFQQHDCAMIATDGHVDTSTRNGKLTYTIISALAEWEREEISERVRVSIPTRARAGKKTGGNAPFGLVWQDNKTVVINEQEAVIVRKAFELFREIKKVSTVADILNKAGYRSRKAEWVESTLKKMLVNRIYIGEYIRNYTNAGRGQRYKPKEEWIINQVPAIINQELWEDVQAVFKSRSIRYQVRVPKEGRWTFSGLLTCECGEKMYVMPYLGMSSPRYTCRACKNKVWEDGVIQNFKAEMERIKFNPQVLQHDNSQIEALKNQLSILKADLIKIERSHDKIFELYNNDAIGIEEFKSRSKPLEDRKLQLKTEIAKIEVELAKIDFEAKGREHLQQEMISLLDAWDDLPDESKRRIARELIIKITVGKEAEGRQKLSYEYYYIPQTTQLSNRTQGFMAATSMKREG